LGKYLALGGKGLLCIVPSHREIACAIRVGDFGKAKFEDNRYNLIGLNDMDINHNLNGSNPLNSNKLKGSY
jgi:hypothetical protein